MTPLLTAIVMWLALNFNLPATDHHPRIEYVPATEITYMRYRAFTPEQRREVAAALAQSGGKPRQAVAIYDDEQADDLSRRGMDPAGPRPTCRCWCMRWCIICKARRR